MKVSDGNVSKIVKQRKDQVPKGGSSNGRVQNVEKNLAPAEKYFKLPFISLTINFIIRLNGYHLLC